MAPITILCMDGGIRGRQLLAMVEEMGEIIGGPLQALTHGCRRRLQFPGAATKMAARPPAAAEPVLQFSAARLCIELCGANQPAPNPGCQAPPGALRVDEP